MVKLSLKEFIRNGKFGAISINSTKEELVNMLGEDYDFADCGDIHIIKYGWYEFYYRKETEKIMGIQNDHLPADCVNHHEMINLENNYCTLDKWFLKENNNITFGEIIKLLKEENIPYEIVPINQTLNQNIIKCINSDVTFDFVNEYIMIKSDSKGQIKQEIDIIETNEENYILNGIRLFEY